MSFARTKIEPPRPRVDASLRDSLATQRRAAVKLEVLERIAAGDSPTLIARAFDPSPHTVKRQVADILDKPALDSRSRAAAWCRQNAAP